MPQSLAQIYLHLVFSTKDRRPFLQNSDLRNEMQHYLGGICNGLDCPILRSITIADLIKQLKRESSKWIKTKSPSLADFHWQNGYGAFSISPGHIDQRIACIVNQEEHHKTEPFQEEYLRLLAKYGLEWDERYMWD